MTYEDYLQIDPNMAKAVEQLSTEFTRPSQHALLKQIVASAGTTGRLEGLDEARARMDATLTSMGIIKEELNNE